MGRCYGERHRILRSGSLSTKGEVGPPDWRGEVIEFPEDKLAVPNRAVFFQNKLLTDSRVGTQAAADPRTISAFVGMVHSFPQVASLSAAFEPAGKKDFGTNLPNRQNPRILPHT
jgi:hypothetical protein